MGINQTPKTESKVISFEFRCRTVTVEVRRGSGTIRRRGEKGRRKKEEEREGKKGKGEGTERGERKRGQGREVQARRRQRVTGPDEEEGEQGGKGQPCKGRGEGTKEKAKVVNWNRPRDSQL